MKLLSTLFLVIAIGAIVTDARKRVMKVGCHLIRNGSNKIVGKIEVEEKGAGRNVHLSVGGLEQYEERKMGFHIHQLSAKYNENGMIDCGSAAGHYNFLGTEHGDRSDNRRNRHTGDLGNVNVNKYGSIKEEFMDRIIRINTSSIKSIIGRAAMLHEGQDDLGRVDNDGSRSTGNAGARYACCTIGILEE